MGTPSSRKIRVGLIGCGAIGHFLAERFHHSPTVQLVRCADDAPAAREQFATAFPHLADCIARADSWETDDITHLVEAAHPSAVPGALRLAATHGWSAICVSVGGFLSEEGRAALLEARTAGISVVIPSGAIGGLDILRAIPHDELYNVTLRTRKHPRSLPADVGAAMTKPTLLFAGTAGEAILEFPKNINVAATLSLAGLGPELTRVEVWADPTVERNRHDIEIVASMGRYEISCANRPMAANPGTSELAAHSIAAVLEGLSSGVRIGT